MNSQYQVTREDGGKMGTKITALRSKVSKVGIVGCGTMGSNWSQICAQKSYQVLVSDVKDDLLKKGLARIKSRLMQDVNKGELSEQNKDAILARIKGTTNPQGFSDCDLVIETAVENMDLKKRIFTELDKICPVDVVLATNTSVLSILDMAMVTSRPDKVVGIHADPLLFPAVEVIKTLVSSSEALDFAENFVRSLGKHPVICKDTPGFIGNRIIIPHFFNIVRLLEAGIATRDELDSAAKLFLFLPKGPLALMDMAGLDTFVLAGNALYEELKEPQYAPPLLLKKMVTAGWLGIKTGKGFYDYDK
jgi:3-hydroxybutyryl-CoA dehydrogenase